MSSSISGATDYSSLFSSLSTSSSKSTNSSSNLLADYASIKNGSYAKLAKSYYGKSDTKASAAAKAEEDKTKKTELTSTKSASSKLSSAANALIDDKSVFQNKIKTKDKDGNETEDYDREKISKLVNNFVDGYNSVVDSSAKSSNNSVLRSGVTMVRTTLANENLLNKVGITIGDDNKLSIDEDTLKKADVGTLKSLFSGQGSYASNIQSSASSILRASENALNSLGGYNASGSYNGAVDTGSLYSSFT
ncbi:MAG: hypothetical protein IJT16_07675 [Lachnospiraceae bacterium]|nr:hypothetical protein [Lachnospiraceae bacterium]